MRLKQTKRFTFLRMESWFFEPAFLSLVKEIKVMIKLVAGYRPITDEGRKLEFASSDKLKFELTSPYRKETLYQDFDCNVYTYAQLAGNKIYFMDGTTMELES
jgi:hypothetical protein